ncbi:hypothetical protein ND861_16915 [Leptospira sp. 2 VSF19]|uniref:Uncharacterized protein n=1 Tax=Leptospira soteropolitanensis TaxID=2950025 RepID=A0AAW5VGA8_9LEPT|nr:hypothetical protein [Leptospira soteropolitanensis]MCW7494329.1 hypothetical protein [Leptospira soteropolitanensis]MCW7501962.1 hypothetical protein [Leptospira soteropolitanensis]MCW7524175.1 hypothetical protein [Leptospira soteropolitanensis]MCW7528040.1 hypothetical protein [Leptospira soteropolitanensis]MCW7531894.1 hypothetical protein [Leptospira soteropolitanensis]
MNTIELKDLPSLKEFSIIAYKWLSDTYPNLERLTNFDPSSELSFPIRWKSKMNGEVFEWVVSDMGSITLRLGGLEGNRRNPSPIFYLSLNKTEEGKFHWTDPEGNPIPFPDPSIHAVIQNRIQLYIDSIS